MSGRFSLDMTAWLAAVCLRSCSLPFPSSAPSQTVRQHATMLFGSLVGAVPLYETG